MLDLLYSSEIDSDHYFSDFYGKIFYENKKKCLFLVNISGIKDIENGIGHVGLSLSYSCSDEYYNENFSNSSSVENALKQTREKRKSFFKTLNGVCEMTDAKKVDSFPIYWEYQLK